MAIEFEEGEPQQVQSTVSQPVNRLRWATHRLSGQSGRRKRMSIRRRLHNRTSSTEKKRESTGKTSSSGSQSAETGSPNGGNGAGSEEEERASPRKIYCNVPLPKEALDEEGHPLATYERNKIRTSRYTPLSFLPKNLWLQFHNIANIYFLFIIILEFFSIFGANNPGLATVPLIFILVVTAIKDGIEDYRRTVLDNELNNSPVYRLVDWVNINALEDNVGPWRRVKKATSRGMVEFWRWVKSVTKKKDKKSVDHKSYAERALDEGPKRRNSKAGRRASSVFTERTSFDSTRSQEGAEHIQMTPVASPDLNENRQSQFSNGGLTYPGKRASTPFAYEEAEAALEYMNGGARDSVRAPRPDSYVKESFEPVSKEYGSVVSKSRKAEEKAWFKKDAWKNVQVGDFIRIYNGDQIPADIVIFSTSDPDGACYVETKNLDGETNLKVREALHCGRKVRHGRDCERAEFSIESEHPHANLYQYSGAIRWQQRDRKFPEAPGKEMTEPISVNNLLLRGCSVRNTDWVLGVAIFTGQETKIMLNSGITPNKRARIARDLNRNVIYNFIILFLMCLVSGIVQGITWAQGNGSLAAFEYGPIGGSPPVGGLIDFWASLILYQNLVPISLYITMEIIRTAQAFFIYSDTYMYYEKIDYPCTPKSWNISDDVGQIEYIFSDKTGTLTQNVMEFKKCTINGLPYGEAYTEAQAGMQRRQGIDVEVEGARAREQIAQDRVRMLEDSRKLYDNPYLHDDELTFVAPDFVTDLTGASGEPQKQANADFMLALALCHTVISERIPGEPPRIEFKAQSPDEAALVATARDCGFSFLGRNNDLLIVNSLGVQKEYQILNTLEFNSSRKRMSAILRMPDTNKIMLFCKGADSIIYSRLTAGEQAELRKTTAEHLEMFAREGLRTLCIAQKEISEEEYRRWNRDHDLAAAAIQDRDEKLEIVSDQIEREMTLLGGTAIEDRLQDGVPDTISLLGSAGIKLWVLTGDKVETAINIGFSCNLLSNDMDLILLQFEEDDAAKAKAEVERHLSSFALTGNDEELKAARKNHEPPEPTHALVIDGDSLKLVLDEEIQQKFLLLCKQCKSVLCCRVSPSQKAAVVQMVKNGLEVMTLSVGDGANDVAMIQEADVGVGIAGEEGRQAVMSSDYAIGQFRFLQRLVLVHGRWSYRRLGESIANFFYKNIVWTFALFWYSIYNSFDCSYLFEYTYILLYNLVFTSLMCILQGILDQDVDDKISLAVPQLYRRGIERKEWTQKKFWFYMLDGVYQSLICFFMPYQLFVPAAAVTQNGLDINDSQRIGIFVACSAVFVVNMYVLLNTYRWDWLILLICAISILLVWFWTGVYSAFESSRQFYKAAPQVLGQLVFWVTVLLTITMSLLPRFTIKAVQKIFFPRDVDIVREQLRMGRFNHLDTNEEGLPSGGGGKDPLVPAEMDSPLANGNDKPRPATRDGTLADDERPIYPPSVAATNTTHNPRSHNGSDGTDYTGHRQSLNLEIPPPPPQRPSLEKPRSSFDRMRSSMDRTRPSFEASRDFTSAALLTRIESSHSHTQSQSQPHTPLQSRRTEDITADLM